MCPPNDYSLPDSAPLALSLSFVMQQPPPISTLFPYTTLFRSRRAGPPAAGAAPMPADPSAFDLVVIGAGPGGDAAGADRKSTRLNSSHTVISYAVVCLKKKKPGRAMGD